MPAYDPDAEINSLSYTVPTWVSSLNRVRSIDNMNQTSMKARDKLQKELLAMCEAIDHMLQLIREA